ncbi:TniB family NTP-binding protein [Undibacterium sp.]|uniref:TniB family NTP-binding protein n=1 Tax=Undibacterium sp. TaxID=1914977 RepID=UPI00273081F3|nr:TniB family NTP-binding protein [Undibacterium sp.]MDP1979391.1 TniB family NTP-binding protein [Undibacterium sp.]
MNIEQVSEQINATTVMHPQFKAAFDGICKLVTQSAISNTPLGASVIAPTGSGKTHLINILVRRFSQKTELTELESTAISISAAAAPSIGSMIDRMLQTLGHPPGIRATRVQDLRQTILMQAIKERGVRFIIIDEFQHLFRGKGKFTASEITDLLKEIMDKTGIPVFVFGTDELGDLQNLDTQFASRIPARYQIRPFSWGEEWLGFLKAFESQVSAYDVRVLSSLAKKLHSATLGSPRTLKYLIIAAAVNAIEKGASGINEEHFLMAFSSTFGASATSSNPFKSK